MISFFKKVFHSGLGKVFVFGYFIPAVLTFIALLAYTIFGCSGFFPDSAISCVWGGPLGMLMGKILLFGGFYLLFTALPFFGILISAFIIVGVRTLRTDKDINNPDD